MTPTTVTATNERLHVTWQGMSPGTPVYIDQCDNVAAVRPGAFQYGINCARLNEQAIDGQSYNREGSGASGHNGGLDPDFKVFVGPEPSGQLGWGCAAEGSPDGVNFGGTLMFNPCLIRIADYAPATPRNVAYLKLTIARPGTLRPPAMTLSASSLTFPGATAVGATSPPLRVTASLAGGANATILAVDPQGIHPLDFRLSGDRCSGVTLTPAAPHCTVALVFSPIDGGARKGIVAWYDSIPTDPPLVLDLSGTAAGSRPSIQVPGALPGGVGTTAEGAPAPSGATAEGRGGAGPSPTETVAPGSGPAVGSAGQRRAAAAAAGSSKESSGHPYRLAAIVVLPLVLVVGVLLVRRRGWRGLR